MVVVVMVVLVEPPSLTWMGYEEQPMNSRGIVVLKYRRQREIVVIACHREMNGLSLWFLITDMS